VQAVEGEPIDELVPDQTPGTPTGVEPDVTVPDNPATDVDEVSVPPLKPTTPRAPKKSRDKAAAAPVKPTTPHHPKLPQGTPAHVVAQVARFEARIVLPDGQRPTDDDFVKNDIWPLPGGVQEVFAYGQPWNSSYYVGFDKKTMMLTATSHNLYTGDDNNTTGKWLIEREDADGTITRYVLTGAQVQLPQGDSVFTIVCMFDRKAIVSSVQTYGNSPTHLLSAYFSGSYESVDLAPVAGLTEYPAATLEVVYPVKKSIAMGASSTDFSIYTTRSATGLLPGNYYAYVHAPHATDKTKDIHTAAFPITVTA
jgi:hypothetical protein